MTIEGIQEIAKAYSRMGTTLQRQVDYIIGVRGDTKEIEGLIEAGEISSGAFDYAAEYLEVIMEYGDTEVAREAQEVLSGIPW